MYLWDSDQSSGSPAGYRYEAFYRAIRTKRGKNTMANILICIPALPRKQKSLDMIEILFSSKSQSLSDTSHVRRHVTALTCGAIPHCGTCENPPLLCRTCPPQTTHSTDRKSCLGESHTWMTLYRVTRSKQLSLVHCIYVPKWTYSSSRMVIKRSYITLLKELNYTSIIIKLHF